MLQILNTIVSLDLLEEYFMCDLEACKGMCCVKGDAGAPVMESEVALLEATIPHLWDNLSAKAKQVIDRQGVIYPDQDNEQVTSIIDNDECVFAYYDPEKCCKCAIEKLYHEGKSRLYKPVSCHLYPVRVAKYKDFQAVNYHRWDICHPATVLGREKGVKLYQFLKEPLILKFGKEWYEYLCRAAIEWKNTKNLK